MGIAHSTNWSHSRSFAVDTAKVPQCFTTYPVRVHKQEQRVAEGYVAARRMFRTLAPALDAYRPNSAGPHGNFFAFSWPDGDVRRVRLAAEIVEALWMYDDITEDYTHEQALKQHAEIGQVLDASSEHAARSKKSLMSGIFQDFGPRMHALDPQGAPAIIASLKAYLQQYDSKDESAFGTVGEYAEYRALNVGFGIMESFMTWCLDVQLDQANLDLDLDLDDDDDEGAQVKLHMQVLRHDFYAAAGTVMALTNDYYSWTVERRAPSERAWNAVPVIMRQHHMAEEDAKIFLQGLVVRAEQRTQELGLALKRAAASTCVRGSSSKSKKTVRDVARYVDGVGLMLGGNCFWSATCPRYNEVKPVDETKR